MSLSYYYHFKLLSRRMATYRHFAFFVAVALLLVAGHRWIALHSDPLSTSAHRSWTFSFGEPRPGLWSSEGEGDDGRQSTSPDHAFVEEADEEDFESEEIIRAHGHGSGQQSPQSSSGPATSAFSYLPPNPLLPNTKLTAHAMGWTAYENIYLSNGTLYIVTSEDERSAWPEVRYMISTALEAVNSPENIKAREPTKWQMSFITPAEADHMWGDRIWELRDWTFMIYDPPQFISHYYHFVAESFFGLWMMFASLDPKITASGKTTLPAPTRLWYPYAEEHQWRDYSRFNQWFLHGVFPEISIESIKDWDGRVQMTAHSNPSLRKAFRLSNLLLTDRSAAFRGQLCPGQTQRIASEAYAVVKDRLSPSWWEPVRRGVLRFSGVSQEVADVASLWDGQWSPGMEKSGPESVAETVSRRMPVVVSYIVRSGHRRTLVKEDDEALVVALTTLCNSKGWELNIVHAERLSREEQVQIAARTTIMLGIHGNGLTHLVWMPITPISAVIEVFVPGGFARDYEWTSRALGMRHFAVWNDTYKTYPDVPGVRYPDGFQGTQIPAHGPSIAKLIEDRVEGRL